VNTPIYRSISTR